MVLTQAAGDEVLLCSGEQGDRHRGKTDSSEVHGSQPDVLKQGSGNTCRRRPFYSSARAGLCKRMSALQSSALKHHLERGGH
jgi:hypothetical protein